MRKVIVLEHISLDGVIQAPGGPDEDTSGGFAYCGWTAPYSDEILGTALRKQMNMPFDLMLGRKTFEIWAPYWPQHADAWPRVMTATKYVASNTMTSHEWQPSVFLNGDIAEQITKIKQQQGPDLHVWSSGNLMQTLIKHDLVDAFWLMIYPVTLGAGKRLFAEGTIPAAFKVTASQVSPSGVIVVNYERVQAQSQPEVDILQNNMCYIFSTCPFPKPSNIQSLISSLQSLTSNPHAQSFPPPNPIFVENLSKTYKVTDREGGMGASVKSFFKRTYKDVHAVQNVSFQISAGEIVGFLGPNGAGKTTTLKMLSGLLYPTGGSANVLGFTPWQRSNAYLRSITLVMGQRNRLNWDIPAADSFLLNQAIYRISDADYKRTFDELDELLELAPIMRKPVRNLSLGERMKCELAAALLHRPAVLFLDELTIGLDIGAQNRIRAFLKKYNERNGATIILTSHYMADVTALCERILIIHQGQLKYDGKLTDLSRRIAPYKLIAIVLKEDAPAALQSSWESYGTVMPSQEEGKILLQVPADQTAEITARLLAEQPVQDLTIEDPPIEDVIDRAFHEEVGER